MVVFAGSDLGGWRSDLWELEGIRLALEECLRVNGYEGEAAAQEPLIEWIRRGAIACQDFVTGESPIRDVERALRAAGAWSFVEEMPEGMHTTVGECGSKRSSPFASCS